jgi:DNA-directed RNA polymerase specialized sigma24 family protein
MSWPEIIERRRDLELRILAETNHLSVSVEVYQFAIAQALFRLTAIQRQAVGLRYLRAMTIADVARDLGMSWDGANEAIDRGTANVLRFIKSSRFEYPAIDLEAVPQIPIRGVFPDEIKTEPHLEVSL